MTSLDFLIAGGGLIVGALGVVATIIQARAARIELRRATQDSITAYKAQVATWAAEALDVLAEATYRVDDLTWKASRVVSIHRLSGLVDRGRLLLPNFPSESEPVGSETAYSGSRHHVLDPLVVAIQVLEGHLGDFPSDREALLAMQREFTTRVQRVVDPRTAQQELQDLWRAANAGTNDGPMRSILEHTRSPGAKALLSRSA